MIGETELRVYGLGSIGKVSGEVYVGLVVLFVVGTGFFLWKKGWRVGFQATSVLLLMEWIFLILCTAVIFRESGESSRINLIPLSSYFDIAENSYFIEAAAVNALNVVMFVPVGLLLGIHNLNANLNCKVYRLQFTGYRQGRREKRWLWVMVVGAGISLTIELLQYIFKRGLFEMDDLIHNVLGCAVGFGIYSIFVWVWRKRRTLTKTKTKTLTKIEG